MRKNLGYKSGHVPPQPIPEKEETKQQILARIRKEENDLREPTVTINGQDYKFQDLPGEIQGLIGVYKEWEDELVLAKKQVFKLEAALKGLADEIELRFKNIES